MIRRWSRGFNNLIDQRFSFFGKYFQIRSQNLHSNPIKKQKIAKKMN